MNIAVQAWGKPVTVPLAWMTLKLVVIAPAMNVLTVTVLIVKRLGDLTIAQGNLMMIMMKWMVIGMPEKDAWCPEQKHMVKVKGTLIEIKRYAVLKTLHVTSCAIVKCPKKLKDDCIINHDIQGNW